MSGSSHQSLGKIREINVAIDEGDDGWARVVIIEESGDSASALVPKDVAHGAALELSPNVTDRRYNDPDNDRSGGGGE